MELADAMTDHLLAIAAEGRSRATQRLYALYERRYLEFLNAKQLPTTLESLDSLHVRQAVLWFQQRRIGTRGGEAATAMFLNVLKTWASYLAAEGVWADSPLRRVQRVKVRKLERQPYTRAECNAILQATTAAQQPERDRLLVLLLLDTGARISEITGLQLGDMRLDRRTVRVLGKGNRERTIPIGAPDQPDGGPLFRALRAYLKVRDLRATRAPDRAGAHLLLTAAGYPLTAEGGSHIIKRLGTAAGVAGAISHRFRHTYCTVYLSRYPGDELGLRRIVGHLSKPVLADYAHIAQAEIAQRAGRVSPTSAWLKEGYR